MTIVPVIYSDRDPFMHTSSSCGRNRDDGKLRGGLVGKYRVNRWEYVHDLGKRICPECWTPGGYDALHDYFEVREP